jgi:flagellar hook-associated protein 2
VDGYPPGSWIERSSNLISDVITGVSLNLVSAAPASTVQLTINDDTSAIKENIQTLVDNYNDVIAYIKEQTKYDTSTGEAGILLGNYAVGIVKSELNAIGTGNAPGFSDPEDKYINLGQIGITTDSDENSVTFGQLLIDDTALDEAVNTDPEAVARLMSAYYRGVSDDATGTISYYSSVQGITQPGIYQVSATVSGGAITSATINGHTATISGDTITGASGYPEYGLAVQVRLTADGTFNGQVRLQEGLNGAFNDKLATLLNSTGPINVVINNYNDIVSNIEDKIDFEVARLEAYRQRLTERFARLEATLSELNSQSEYLSNQLSQLNSSKK